MASSSLPTTFPSILAHAPHIDTSTTPPRPHPNWTYTTSTSFPSQPPQPHPTELLIRLTATGICHTDVFISSIPPGMVPNQSSYPVILGHEGAGTVLGVGKDVTVAKEGDHVLLSYDYCGSCAHCKRGGGACCDCDEFSAKNTQAVQGVFRAEGADGKEGMEVSGKFFGQSSFSSFSLVEQNSVVNVTDLLKNPEEELKLLAPLGCGLMTGVGGMCNVASLTKDSVVLVLGAGAVGFGAIMAARNLGVKGVIVVDRIPHRLATAKDLGATETVDTTGKDMAKIHEEIMGLAAQISGGNPLAIDVAFETTGNVKVTEAGMKALGMRGLMIAVGVPQYTAKFEFSAMDIYFMRKRYVMNLLGNSESRVVLPRMIQWWQEGKFEIERLVKYFDAKDAVKALEGMESGEVVKPVVVW